MEDYLRVNDKRVSIVNQPERRYASIRYEISTEMMSDYILAIDDDVFLSPEQLRDMFSCLVLDPMKVHGFAGQVYSEDLKSCSMFLSRNMPVEALVMMFAYTKTHLKKYFEIMNQLGIENKNLKSSEDVPLSFSGNCYARIHDIGYVARCPSADKEGVATWTAEGFDENRRFLVREMRELCLFDSGILKNNDVATA